MWPSSSSVPHYVHEHVASRDAELDAIARHLDDVRAGAPQKKGGDDDHRDDDHRDDVQRRLAIVSLPIERLAAELRQGTYTAVEVLRAFILASLLAHEATRCLTETNFRHALRRAHQLDEYRRNNEGATVGPLHGVPFSIKDCFHLEGTKTTVGYSRWTLDERDEHSAALVHVVHHLGGVVFVKTNIPQTMLAFECSNPVWGRSLNPWSEHHTCGGSSGGEAALLACDGAAAGWGSDIGGSLRIPTSYCGIYALKPTAGRFPNQGTRRINPGFTGVPVVSGPMTRSADDLAFMLATFVRALHFSPGRGLGDEAGGDDDDDDDRGGPEGAATLRRRRAFRTPAEAQRALNCEPLRWCPLDELALTKPFEAATATGTNKGRRALRIGYFYCDGFNATSPACVRAVRESVSALRQAYPVGASSSGGRAVELVEVEPAVFKVREAMALFVGLVSSDRYDALLAPLRRPAVAPSKAANGNGGGGSVLGRFFRGLLRLLGLGGSSSDRREPALFLPLVVGRSAWPLRLLIYVVLRYVLRDAALAALGRRAGAKSAQQFIRLQAERADYADEVERRLFGDAEAGGLGLDAVIAPVQAIPAVPHGGAFQLSPLAASTIIFNMIDSSVAVCPVTRVDRRLDAVPRAASPTSSPEQREARARWLSTRGFETCSWLVARTLYGARMGASAGPGSARAYDAERMHGLPVGVQVACRRHEEEKAVGVMRVVDEAVRLQRRSGVGSSARGDEEAHFEQGAWAKRAALGQGKVVR